MLIKFYQITKDLNEIVVDDLAIFYSFKMPVACRRKKTFIVRDMDPRHLKEITTNKKFKQLSKDEFFKKLNQMEKAAIKDLAQKKEVNHARRKPRNDKQDRPQGKSRVVIDLPDRNEAQRRASN